MKTSYFSNLKNVVTPVSISRTPPPWYTGRQFRSLAPPFSIVRAHKLKQITDEEYTHEFKKLVLEPLDASVVYKDLVDKFGEHVTLLCFEKPGDFCHRRIVAEWFEQELGVKVDELPPASFYRVS
jgi:hypothetical protein